MTHTTRLLLVDDERDVRVTLAALLEEEVGGLDEAGDIPTAMALVTSAEHYDFVVLDRHIGEGSGLDLLPALREHQPRARVVLLSGDPGTLLTEELTQIAAVVAKGARFEALLAALGMC